MGSREETMRLSFLSGIALAVVLSPAVAGATPSTQIWIPSPDTVSFLNAHLGADNYFTIFRKADDDAWAAPTDLGLTIGLSPSDIVGLEVGVDLFEPTDSPLVFNAKAALLEGKLFDQMPGVAVGIFGVGTDTGNTDMNMVYGLVGKEIWKLGRISAGYYWGNKDVLTRPNGDADERGLLLSWDRTISEVSDNLWVAVDWQQGRSVMGATGFGAGWTFSDQIGVILGYVLYGQKASPGTLTVQLDIDLAMLGSAEPAPEAAEAPAVP
jgi:hypothetical protein